MKSLVNAFVDRVPMPTGWGRGDERVHGHSGAKRTAWYSRLSGLRQRSLRVKGRIIFALFVSYSILLGGFVMYQKGVLLREFADLQDITNTSSTLGQFDADAVLAGNVPIATGDPQYTGTEVSEARARLRAMWNQYASLTAGVPEVPLALGRLDAALRKLAAQPSESALTELRTQLISEHASLTSLGDRLRSRRDAMAEEYRQRSNSVAAIALLLGAGGLVTFGIILIVFFTRLTNDVLILKDYAKVIARRDRHEVIRTSRRDEVGELMDAINRMSRELDERDKQLEIEHRKYFYREKMAAIGDLATGIAHEIGNPISAIAGVATSMQEVQTAGGCPKPDCGCQPALILAQTARLAAIAREIADFAMPVPAERQLLNVNDVIQSTCVFLRYDRRFRGINLETNLNRGIPAVSVVHDRLVQVIMNLLINAVDALDGLQDRVPKVSITTSLVENQVCIAVADNGCGMDDKTLRHAFEAFFTTKRPGRGTGLGLSLCYSILEEHGGRIDLDSIPNQGTCVRVMLPLGSQSGEQMQRQT
ncbi:MAG: GHKL domain-containing protein [Alphaproteobacteria bacterium]|nr:GHKL domain-containing protein [Alphaproteobacteria bacterium]